MNNDEIKRWLFNNGGPVIRYRTATELISPSDDIDIYRLKEELLESNPVKTWLGKCTPSFVFNDIHGSKSSAFESVMGKLTDLGLRKGDPDLDRYTLPYRDWLSENTGNPTGHIFDIFIRTLVAAFLARAGYTDDQSVSGVLKERLTTLCDFTKQGNYNIYVDPAGYPAMPGSFRNRPLIDPALYQDGYFCLPWIYDIIGLDAYLQDCGKEEDFSKVQVIIHYILATAYQKQVWGYGILFRKPRQYYAMGWSVHLPGFFSALTIGSDLPVKFSETQDQLVQSMVLMGRFPETLRHPWFTDSINHLQEFQTEKGTYLFPRSYLPEKSNNYWVTGGRMGLEEKRKNSLAIELESTFWMMKLLTFAS